MDIQKTTNTLNLTMEFVDGDTRLLTVDNPLDNIDSTPIKTLESEMKTGQPLLGDKTGAEFKQFKRAWVKTQTVTKLDLSE